MSLSFSASLKKAWQKTFLPLVDEEERDKCHFGHYFMGWPSHTNGSKIAYLITAKFITSPLTNLFTLAVEFPFNFLSETCAFLKNKLNFWVPRNRLTQELRSFLIVTMLGLQALFKGLSYFFRTITSPLISFKAARKTHPVLGYISALTSVLLIGSLIIVLAVFAPQIVAALLPSMGSTAITLLSTLAYPFIELFSVIGLSLSAATGAMLTLISGSLLLSGLHLIGWNTIYLETKDTVNHIDPPELPQTGSNVSDLLARSDRASATIVYGCAQKKVDDLISYLEDCEPVAENTRDVFIPDPIQATIDASSSSLGL